MMEMGIDQENFRRTIYYGAHPHTSHTLAQASTGRRHPSTSAEYYLKSVATSMDYSEYGKINNQNDGFIARRIFFNQYDIRDGTAVTSFTFGLNSTGLEPPTRKNGGDEGKNRLASKIGALSWALLFTVESTIADNAGIITLFG